MTNSEDTDCAECALDAKESCESEALGICQPGSRTCVLQGSELRWSACAPMITPGAQREGLDTGVTCSNQLDDDCDGKVDEVDEDCRTCTSGQVQNCFTGEPGICNEGQKTCTNDLWPMACQALHAPTAEDCTDADSDCDGEVGALDLDCRNCGDGIKQLLEECDGQDFSTTTCESSGFDQGALSCRDSQNPSGPCTIDYSGCITCTAPTPPAGVVADRIVDKSTGNNSTAVGTCIAYQTITAALSGLSAGAVVWVAPGSYDNETFPVTVPAGVRLIGDELNQGATTSIRGDGMIKSGWYAVVVLSTGSELTGFRVVSTRSSGLLAGVFATDVPARIAYNDLRGRSAGISFSITGEVTLPTQIENNHFSSATEGIRLSTTSVPSSPHPRIRNNTFDEQTNAAIYCWNNCAPDLGQDPLTDPGGNTFAPGPGSVAIYHSVPTEVLAHGNTWPIDPPGCGTEIVVTQGKVTWGPDNDDFCAP